MIGANLERVHAILDAEAHEMPLLLGMLLRPEHGRNCATRAAQDVTVVMA